MIWYSKCLYLLLSINDHTSTIYYLPSAKLRETFVDFDFAIEWLNCENCAPGPWHISWRSQAKNCYTDETVRGSAKMWEYICTIWHLPSNLIFAGIALPNHDQRFEAQKFISIFYISEVQSASAKMCGKHSKILTFVIEWCNCENCTPWPWHTFQDLMFKICIYLKRSEQEQKLQEIFADFDIWHQMA